MKETSIALQLYEHVAPALGVPSVVVVSVSLPQLVNLGQLPAPAACPESEQIVTEFRAVGLRDGSFALDQPAWMTQAASLLLARAVLLRLE